VNTSHRPGSHKEYICRRFASALLWPLRLRTAARCPSLPALPPMSAKAFCYRCRFHPRSHHGLLSIAICVVCSKNCLLVCAHWLRTTTVGLARLFPTHSSSFTCVVHFEFYFVFEWASSTALSSARSKLSRTQMLSRTDIAARRKCAHLLGDCVLVEQKSEREARNEAQRYTMTTTYYYYYLFDNQLRTGHGEVAVDDEIYMTALISSLYRCHHLRLLSRIGISRLNSIWSTSSTEDNHRSTIDAVTETTPTICISPSNNQLYYKIILACLS
jgi:hypothetical protein